MQSSLCVRRPSLVLSYIGSVTARHSSSGRQPNFAALSRGRYLYLAGQPSRWALAHILVQSCSDQVATVGLEKTHISRPFVRNKEHTVVVED